MPDDSNAEHLLHGLAQHLQHHRADILACWRSCVEREADLPDGAQWTAAQVFDHFPDVLEGAEQLFAVWPDPAHALWQNQDKLACEHARYRWLQGFNLRTIAQEWGGLNRCVLGEIARYFSLHPHAQRLISSLELWSRVLDRHLTESVAAFHEIEQAEAATRSQELREALERLEEIGALRGQAVGAMTRELRNTLSVVQTSAVVLGDESVSVTDRKELQLMLNSGVQSVGATLAHLTTLAQLESGLERLAPEALDASEAIDIIWSAQADRFVSAGISTSTEGPGPLWVEGEPARLSLLLTHLVAACAASAPGGRIEIKWGEDQRSPSRWFINLAHSVSGDRKTSPAAIALSEATRIAHETERQGQRPAIESRGPAPVNARGSDGIHLVIAKRVCEILQASLEIEVTPQGLQYRVTLPKTYKTQRPA